MKSLSRVWLFATPWTVAYQDAVLLILLQEHEAVKLNRNTGFMFIMFESNLVESK